MRMGLLQFSADVATGTAVAIVNDWNVLIANLLLIGGRIILEWIILKQNRRAQDKEKR